MNLGQVSLIWVGLSLVFTPRESNLKQGSSQSHRGAPSKVDSMVDKLYYGLRNIDFACLFADTASARLKSPRMGTFAFEASDVPAHMAREIRTERVMTVTRHKIRENSSASLSSPWTPKKQSLRSICVTGRS